MKHAWLPFFAAFAALAQQPGVPWEPPLPPARSPSPELRRRERDAISKQEFQDNTRDIAKILDLAQGLQSAIERNGPFIVDAHEIRDAEQIEKLAKNIRGRLKSF
jgi:hypothetical protein